MNPDPDAPVAPVGPVAPVAPVGPVGPVAPVLPVGPVGPVAPVAPAAPTPPLTTQYRLASAPEKVTATVLMVGTEIVVTHVVVMPENRSVPSDS